MFFAHFVSEAHSREPHRLPIFLTSRTLIRRYVCVGPDRSAGLDNTGSPGDLRSPGLFNCLNCALYSRLCIVGFGAWNVHRM
jgi:hypothetical protein